MRSYPEVECNATSWTGCTNANSEATKPNSQGNQCRNRSGIKNIENTNAKCNTYEIANNEATRPNS